ncbi:MAG: lysoplasmalogenase [Chitinophagaceae bacterium]
MMKQNHWILLFIIVLAGYITGMQLQSEGLQLIFKPLIVTVLIGYFNSRVTVIGKGLAKWILVALLFSLAGDVLLLFVNKNELFFLLGLSSFLLAHIFYIHFFDQVKRKEVVKSKIWPLAVVAVYYAGLIYLLAPHLKDMKAPVLVYGIVISLMFMLAMHMLFIKNKAAGKWMMTGALLFVISDSTLAIDKFYQPFEAAGIIIMLTYGAAQFFIVKGAADYISLNSDRG